MSTERHMPKTGSERQQQYRNKNKDQVKLSEEKRVLKKLQKVLFVPEFANTVKEKNRLRKQKQRQREKENLDNVLVRNTPSPASVVSGIRKRRSNSEDNQSI